MSVKTRIRYWSRRRRRRTYVGLLELERSELRRRVRALERELAAAFTSRVDDAKATVDAFARQVVKNPVHDRVPNDARALEARATAREAELERRRSVREQFAYLIGSTPEDVQERIASGEFSTADLERYLASAEMPVAADSERAS